MDDALRDVSSRIVKVEAALADRKTASAGEVAGSLQETITRFLGCTQARLELYRQAAEVQVQAYKDASADVIRTYGAIKDGGDDEYASLEAIAAGSPGIAGMSDEYERDKARVRQIRGQAGSAASGRNTPRRSRGLVGTVTRALSDAGVQAKLLLKGVRLAVQVFALYVAQKVFNESYTRTVYGEGEDPPELRSMLFMFLSVDATAQLLLMLIVVLLSYVFKASDNTFALDDDFVALFLAEYFVSTVALLVIGLLFASLLRQKKYFDYPNQGSAVSSAYRDLMMGVCAVSCLVPYGVLFS